MPEMPEKPPKQETRAEKKRPGSHQGGGATAATPKITGTKSLTDRFAELCSHVFNPPVVAFLVLLYASLEEKAQQSPKFIPALIYGLTISLIFPLVTTLVLRKTGLIGNFFYSTKKDRIFLFPMLLVIMAALWLIIRAFFAKSAVVNYLEMSFILFVTVLAITPLTKISLHMTGLSSLMMMALWLWGMDGLVLAPILPLVAWARVQLRQHTPAQVLLGTLVGGLLPLLYFFFIGA